MCNSSYSCNRFLTVSGLLNLPYVSAKDATTLPWKVPCFVLSHAICNYVLLFFFQFIFTLDKYCYLYNNVLFLFLRRTSCASCLGDPGVCAWCEETQTCFPFSVYTSLYSYGKCRDWVDENRVENGYNLLFYYWYCLLWELCIIRFSF